MGNLPDIQFTLGAFRDFRATVRFHLGKIQQDVPKDTVVQFDGTTMRLNEVAHPYPELRSAIRSGWLALVGANVGDYVPQSSNAKMRSAQDTAKVKTASTEVQRDETYVAPARKTTLSDGVKLESKAFNSALIRDTEGDGRSVGSAVGKKATAGTTASSEGETVARLKTPAKRSFSLDGSTSLNSDGSGGGVVEHVKPAGDTKTVTREGQSSETGKVIASVATAARRKVTLTDANDVSREIHKVENTSRQAAPSNKVLATETGSIVAASGDTVQEILEVYDNPGKVLAERKRAERLARIHAGEQAKKARDSEVEPLPTVVNVTPASGLVDAPETQIDVQPSRSVRADLEDHPHVDARSPKSVEDFAVNGDDLELAPGVRWNKKLHWKTRVKAALVYKDQPEVMALICGYEVPSVVKQIEAELAKP